MKGINADFCSILMLFSSGFSYLNIWPKSCIHPNAPWHCALNHVEKSVSLAFSENNCLLYLNLLPEIKFI